MQDQSENNLMNPISRKELRLIQSLVDIQNPVVKIFGTIDKIE